MTADSSGIASIVTQIGMKQFTAEELSSLVGTSEEVDRLIASSSQTRGDTLEKLASSTNESVRQMVQSNPNTPLEVLMDLADEFPQAFLLNPTSLQILLEDPGVLESLHESTLAKILEQRDCPLHVVCWAWNFYKRRSFFSSRVLKGVAANPSTPVRIIASILRLEAGSELTCEEGWL
jgi:hypothetical protein